MSISIAFQFFISLDFVGITCLMSPSIVKDYGVFEEPGGFDYHTVFLHVIKLMWCARVVSTFVMIEVGLLE